MRLPQFTIKFHLLFKGLLYGAVLIFTQGCLGFFAEDPGSESELSEQSGPTPIGISIQQTLDEDEVYNGQLDIENTPKEGARFYITTPPADGSVSLNFETGTFSFTPKAEFSGETFFQYEIEKFGKRSEPRTVSFLINPINDAPLGGSTTTEPMERNTSKDIILTATDAEGDPYTFAMASMPENGTATLTGNTVRYVPNNNFIGTDTFTFTVNDGNSDSKQATITIPVVRLLQVVPWGISRVQSKQVEHKGREIKICISDTGADLDHEDLAANIIDSFSVVDGKPSAEDDHGHGTHVAGTIAAIDNAIGVIGVAPKAKLIIAKGLDENGLGTSFALAQSIDNCVAKGADIINMSWGSNTFSQVIKDAIVDAYNAGVILIAAAGNTGIEGVSYPAIFPEVIAVSATDINDNIASFSTTGDEVAFAAPGVNVLSTGLNGNYFYQDGTSMASPHVAGIAALMLESNANLTKDNLGGVDIGLTLKQQGPGGLINAIESTD